MKEKTGITFYGQISEIKTSRFGGYKIVIDVPDSDGEKMQVGPIQELLAVIMKNCQIAIVPLKDQ